MDLMHRIVAMADGKPARAECLTCHSQHNYYRPRSAEEPRAPRATGVKRVGNPKTTPRTSTQSAVGQRAHWERSIAGRTPGEFVAYSIAASYAVGQLVRHAKFGDGVVTAPQKITALFADGPKLLAQAMSR
jgi:hypothetical protein